MLLLLFPFLCSLIQSIEMHSPFTSIIFINVQDLYSMHTLQVLQSIFVSRKSRKKPPRVLLWIIHHPLWYLHERLLSWVRTIDDSGQVTARLKIATQTDNNTDYSQHSHHRTVSQDYWAILKYIHIIIELWI